jgi:hypothetical protein
MHLTLVEWMVLLLGFLVVVRFINSRIPDVRAESQNDDELKTNLEEYAWTYEYWAQRLKAGSDKDSQSVQSWPPQA